ncbi:MAG: type IX secretion system PorP/SprF family membrane protein [Salibacteraceae bacterium]|jgi:type IX secretion system PorP/SprF family membrane protein
MKKNIQYIIVTAFVLSSIGFESFGQQTVLSNFYYKNGYSVNPANAGVDKSLSVNLTHRQQWVGVSGSPSAFNFNMHGELSENNAIGLKFSSEAYGLIRRNAASGTYAYNLKFNPKHNLRFGVSVGFNQNTINYSAIRTQDFTDDIILEGNMISGISLNADFGIRYSVGNFQFGIASLQLVESSASMYLENDKEGFFNLTRHFVANTSYGFKVSDNWTISPAVLAEFTLVTPFSIEGLIYADWNDQIWFGAGYRKDAGILTSFGLKISNQFLAGYSYEFSSSGIAAQSRGTHEVMLGYKLGNKKKDSRIEDLEKKIDQAIIDNNNDTDSLVTEVDNLKEELEGLKKYDETNVDKIEELEKRIEELEKGTPKGKEDDPLSQSIYFDENQSSINSNSKEILDELVGLLKANSEMRIRIIGHTCNIGTPEMNKEISMNRSKKTLDYFVSKGIPSGRIELEGRGQDEPLVSNNSELNRSLNRRVSFEKL